LDIKKLIGPDVRSKMIINTQRQFGLVRHKLSVIIHDKREKLLK